jgi:flagellar M-ring protein FliF
MSKLSEFFKGYVEKWKELGKGKKIAFGVSFIGVLVILVYLSITLGATKYSVLFSDLETNEAKAITDKLAELKVTDVKIQGNKILVPEDMVDQLRMELAPSIESSGGGWSLFDTNNTFASTDAELKIKYQRALQAELEKTIKTFPQIERAKVNLVLPEESVFVKDDSPASASVTLIMKSGQSLNDDQVRSIAALVSGSVKNLPKENIQIVDDKMKLLTQDLFNNDNDISKETDKQQAMKKDYEKQLESKLMEQLSRPFKNKVTVKVNVDLDFDAVQNVTTTVDKQGTPISEKTITDTTGDGTDTRPSQSPVDNNMTNGTTTDSNTATAGTNHSEKTVNYQVGQSETKTIKAPGSVKRITASVIIDGNLDDSLKAQVRGLVAGAIGFDDKRGDNISVEGIRFDSSDADITKKALEEMQAAEKSEQMMNLYKLAAAGVGGLILLIVLIAMLRKGKKRSPQEEQLDAIVTPKGIDVLIGELDQKAQVVYNPIDFDKEVNSEKAHLEKEIKRYAAEKPDQVADIIKSWLAEDER